MNRIKLKLSRYKLYFCFVLISFYFIINVNDVKAID